MDNQQPETPWEFKPGDNAAPATPQYEPSPLASTSTSAEPVESQLAPTGPITWTASEFIAHHKSTDWYIGLGVSAVVLAAIVYLLTRDKISTGVVIVAAAALGGYAGRQPKQIQFNLDDRGLSIGERHYPFELFRSFAVMDEGAFSSIAFLPLKRFGTLTTIYYDPKDEEAIINLLSERLPMEPRQHDMVDRFMKRIKF